MKALIMQFSAASCHFSPLSENTLPTIFSDGLNSYSSFNVIDQFSRNLIFLFKSFNDFDSVILHTLCNLTV
jgi:hypothetical protein